MINNVVLVSGVQQSDLVTWTFTYTQASLLAQTAESAYNAGDLGSVPGSGRSPGEGMMLHSSIIAWRIPWTEEPGGPEFMWSHMGKHQIHMVT